MTSSWQHFDFEHPIFDLASSHPHLSPHSSICDHWSHSLPVSLSARIVPTSAWMPNLLIYQYVLHPRCLSTPLLHLHRPHCCPTLPAQNCNVVMILGPTTNFPLFSAIYSMLSVTHSPLVPSRAARTTTESPDKSPDGPPDHSAVRYHMPSLRSPQHSTASTFNPLWIASSLPRHDRSPAHDGAILRTASS